MARASSRTHLIKLIFHFIFNFIMRDFGLAFLYFEASFKKEINKIFGSKYRL